MWTSTLPDDPIVARWWRDRERQIRGEQIRREVTVAAELRAERIERCRQLAHRVDMRAAGALSRDRRARIERRRDERSSRAYGGYEPVEHSAHAGRVLNVR